MPLRRAGDRRRRDSRREAELERRRDWYRRPARSAQGARAHDRRHRASGRARTSATTIAYDADAVAKQWKDRAATARHSSRRRDDALEATTPWEPAALEESLRALAEQLGFGEKAGKIFQPLRVALTGLAASPGIFDVLLMLGRERSLARIDARGRIPALGNDSLRSERKHLLRARLRIVH